MPRKRAAIMLVAPMAILSLGLSACGGNKSDSSPAAKSSASAVTPSSSPSATKPADNTPACQPSVNMTQIPVGIVDGDKGTTFKGTMECFGTKGMLMLDKSDQYYLTDETPTLAKPTKDGKPPKFSIEDTPIGQDGDNKQQYAVAFVVAPVSRLTALVGMADNDGGLTQAKLKKADVTVNTMVSFVVTNKKG